MSQAEPNPPSLTTNIAANKYTNQSQKLSLEKVGSQNQGDNHGRAVEATFITPLDPVIQTSDGNRLPVVPIDEAYRINLLKDQAEGKKTKRKRMRPRGLSRFDQSYANAHGILQPKEHSDKLGEALPLSQTHPLFPPLPLYGPPSLLRDLHCWTFRITSFFLSAAFLLVIVLGSIFTSVPKVTNHIWLRLTFRDPNARRPFYEEERRRAALRKEEETRWYKRKRDQTRPQKSNAPSLNSESTCDAKTSFVPLEGGHDPLVCDARYYARRVGLDIEQFQVQTEDGFIVTLWHVFNPSESQAAPKLARQASSPEVFASNNDETEKHSNIKKQFKDGNRRYPVLLMHGLLQSAGAYCSNDDDSLAFFLCKSGYDVWLGNNRCGFNPEHSLLSYGDPRMWAWNIRQMGVMDLPALISRVLEETGFARVGLICHSQGTTQTFVALAKEQRPDLGEKISVFCALAPAVYAGPLIEKMYFKFMRVISPAMFRVFFGIHAFIPLMMTMHKWLPGKVYGLMGYQVFSFLFNWTDTRWDIGLRDRLFQFSPVYVSSESMRWWLGRECFAKHKCILSTALIEDHEDHEDFDDNGDSERLEQIESRRPDRGRTAWYNEQMPPLAMWVAGSDDLVDGRRLLRRFERGREPYVKVVHAKVIEPYEHLDVLWAVDAIEQVGTEVREVIWRTMNDEERGLCRTIEGVWDSDDEGDGQEEDEELDEEKINEKEDVEATAVIPEPNRAVACA